MRKPVLTWSIIITLIAISDRLLFVMFPNYLIEKNFSGLEIGIIFSVASFGLVVSRIFIGRIGDFYSRKTIMSSGLLAQALSVSFFPFVSRIYEFIIVKGVKDAAENMSSTTEDAMVADTFPKETRSKALARLGAAMPLGRVLGSIIGFFVTAYFAIVYGFFIVSFFLLAVFFLLVFTQKRPEPKTEKKIKFQLTRNMKIIAVIGFLISLNYSLAYFPAFFLLAKNLGIGTDMLFLLLLGTNLISIPLAYTTDKWIGRIGKKNLAAISIFVFSLFILLYLIASDIVQFFIFLAFVSASYYIWRIAFKNIMMDSTVEATRGGEIGFVKFFHGLGDIAGPLIAGVLIQFISLNAAFVTTFIVGLVAVIMLKSLDLK